jgi:hypothetical protein
MNPDHDAEEDIISKAKALRFKAKAIAKKKARKRRKQRDTPSATTWHTMEKEKVHIKLIDCLFLVTHY